MPLYNHSDILSESNTQIESDYPHRKPPEVAVTMDLEAEQEPERMIIIGHIRYTLREPLSEFLCTFVMRELEKGVESQVNMFQSKMGGWTSIVFANIENRLQSSLGKETMQ